MPGDNLSAVLEMIRAELERMGTSISLEQMRRASLPARRIYGTTRIYVEALPRLQKLQQLQDISPDDHDARSLAQTLDCSDYYARRLRALMR